jgi:hypothetical protein
VRALVVYIVAKLDRTASEPDYFSHVRLSVALAFTDFSRKLNFFQQLSSLIRHDFFFEFCPLHLNHRASFSSYLGLTVQ